MANFNEAFEILMRLEFRGASDALHINPTEDGLTFMGIYEKAHPRWPGWDKIRASLRNFKNLEYVSNLLYKDSELREMVRVFYKRVFWGKMRGDEIDSQLKANEIFIFGVNVGMKKAIKTVQEIVGAEADGVMGEITLDALNNYKEENFDKAFDRAEIAYYQRIIESNPSFRIYANGWRNRAYAV